MIKQYSVFICPSCNELLYVAIKPLDSNMYASDIRGISPVPNPKKDDWCICFYYNKLLSKNEMLENWVTSDTCKFE